MANPYINDPDFVLYVGDVRDVLLRLPNESVDCCVTSPPYWGLRDYGVNEQIGLELTPEGYVDQLVQVFAQVRRLLKPEGTLWLNLGDSYAGQNVPGWRPDNEAKNQGNSNKNGVGYVDGLKPKDLVGIPWRVAFALQADGWYLRSDIIWAKPNPMPESVTDRPTKAHEYVFLLSKGPRYFYDAAAIREISDAIREIAVGTERRARRTALIPAQTKAGVGTQGIGSDTFGHYSQDGGRNARSVWEIATQPYPQAHFATFPEELPRRCILAGCPEGGTVLDPFMGSGTTAKVARDHGRQAVGVELNREYADLCARRLQQLSLLADLPEQAA